MKNPDIKKLTDRLSRIEYELTEVRFRCKTLECINTLEREAIEKREVAEAPYGDPRAPGGSMEFMVDREKENENSNG